MGRAYSDDLRDRALILLEIGHTQLAVSTLLDVSVSTLKLWKAAVQRENRRTAKQGYQKGHSHKILDPEVLKKALLDHPNKTLEEIGRILPNHCSGETVRCALKKFGFTYKKKSFIISKEIQKSAMLFLKK
jgi:transposase